MLYPSIGKILFCLFIFPFGDKVIQIRNPYPYLQPVPYMLKSGYVAVMTEEARLCYHAVPRKIDIFMAQSKTMHK